jgi:hypothetical protein
MNRDSLATAGLRVIVNPLFRTPRSVNVGHCLLQHSSVLILVDEYLERQSRHARVSMSLYNDSMSTSSTEAFAKASDPCMTQIAAFRAFN